MATNKIQIKRSVANSVVTGLSNGELAFTANGNILYIGDPAGAAAIPIGSKLNYGTLTANSVLVTNATSGINEIIVGDIILTGTTQTVSANGSVGTAGQVLISGGAANAYWAAASALTGTVNTAAAFTWTNAHVFQNTVAITGGLTVNSSFTANGGLGTAGQVLVTAGAGNVYWATVSSLTSTVNTAAQYTWTNTNVFQIGLSVGNSSVFNITNTSLAYTGNATTLPTITLANTGAFTIGNSVTTQTTSTISVANSTGNVQITPGTTSILATGIINAASHTVGTAFTANSTVVNAVSYYSGSLLVANSTVINATHLVGKTEGGLNVNTALTSNNSTNFGGQLPAYYTNASNITTGTLPWAQAPAGTVNTAGSFTLAGNTTLAGTNTVISSNLTTTGASITGTSTDVSFRNGTFSGNLTVSGTVVTVNTAQLQVNDNIIQLAYNQTTTDTVDTGWSSVAGNSSSIWYSGIARIAASSTNAAPVFRVFGSNTNPNTASTIDSSANTRTGFLQSYLIPYGTGGALVVNATNISVTGNSTVAVAIAANSLSLTTALPGTSGGTGLSTIANNSLIFGNSTNGFNALAFNSTAGHVLQSNGTAIVYDTLDGGTF
jgi:hypothetical protein